MNRISKQILQSSQFFPKILVGTLLVYSLIGIPFVVGYLARSLHQQKESRTFNLPQWNHWLALLVECWELLFVIMLYGVLPIGISCLISTVIDQWFGHLLWIPLWVIPWIPTMLLCLVCPMVIALAYAQYLKKGTFDSLFDFSSILKDFRNTDEDLIMLTLMFWGLVLIGFPIFGFTITLASLLYLTLVTKFIELS